MDSGWRGTDVQVDASGLPAVILAAGTGFRLNAGRALPKCLTPVAGRPLLAWIADALTSAGVRQIYLVLGCHAEQVEKAVPKIESLATITTTRCPDWELGNGRSAAHAETVIGSAPRFLLLMGDHLIIPEHVSALIEAGMMAGDHCVLATAIPGLNTDNADATKVLADADGRILAIGKTLPRYTAIDTGVFSMTPRLFPALAESMSMGDCSLTGGNRVLASRAELFAHSIGDLPWQDVDTPEDLLAAEALKAASTQPPEKTSP
jgi:1L-myo-inositol 1-phosphate cytidylyltransferase